MNADLEFTDYVTDFGSEGRGINVLFARQAATYRLPAEAVDFEKSAIALITSWKQRRPVSVAVKGTGILDVKVI